MTPFVFLAVDTRVSKDCMFHAKNDELFYPVNLKVETANPGEKDLFFAWCAPRYGIPMSSTAIGEIKFQCAD